VAGAGRRDAGDRDRNRLSPARLDAAGTVRDSRGMVTCQACGTTNEPGRKFCSECGTPLAATCPMCGSANQQGAKFCGECGAHLGEAQPAAAPTAQTPAAERRLVSVLFADLVGFTTVSESRDAEEVRELLSRYFDTATKVIQRYGGTVEKFIGDAVMAVWGTPVAQEDDAERAVRAALDLVAAVPTLEPRLQARAGVLTGEAAVTIGAQGQGMVAGDLVNTAARIQGEAEPGTVLVGDSTKHATEAALDYEDAGAHELKGKSGPAQLWRPLRVVAARRGAGRTTGLEAPFVGREREFRVVKDLFNATAEDRRVCLVTVIGPAGIGKSRLAWEFEKYIDGVADDVWWHRGRCLSYGDGVAYWALAEMVRMRSGIAEDENEATAVAKLGAVVGEHLDDPEEREWVFARLQQLLGLGARAAPSQEDLFAAWRLFFEKIAARGTVVLVFEDVHWADAGLLDFIEHLLDRSRDHPIYVVALARPEVVERHPEFGRSARSATTLVLEPLSDDAMDALLQGLAPGLPDALRTTIRERADGFPLYAVETVRMLLDRGVLERDGDRYVVTGSIAELEVPATLHALIASRLDALEPAERHALETAAVLGKTFTRRGLATVAGMTEEELEPLLAALVRKELLFFDTDPRSPERGQYGFLQALVQRVAYDTLSRHERRARHLAAAGFLADGAGIDADEIAEVIAAHYRDAYAADTAADDAESLRVLACQWLVRAGDRAAALAATNDARRAFDDAAALTGEGPERAALLERAGHLASAGNEPSLAIERLEAARGLYEQAGLTHDAARASALLSMALWASGRAEESLAVIEPALAMLAEDEPDADFARLAAEAARIHFFTGDLTTALERVETALDVAESQMLPVVLSQALNTKALLIKTRRPREARALMLEALAVALEHDLTDAALRAYNNLVVLADAADRIDESRALKAEGLDLARRRGHVQFAAAFAAMHCGDLLDEGEWDAAFALADDVLPEAPTAVPSVVLAFCWLAHAAQERDDKALMARLLARIAPEVEMSTEVQLRSLGLLREVVLATADGRTDDVYRLSAQAIDRAVELGYADAAAEYVGRALTYATDSGDPSPALALIAHIEAVPIPSRTRSFTANMFRGQAVAHARAGNDEAAAEAFAIALAAARNLGAARLLGPVLVDYGRWLIESGRSAEAAPLLAEAEVLFTRMGATKWLHRIAPLLDDTRETARA